MGKTSEFVCLWKWTSQAFQPWEASQKMNTYFQPSVLENFFRLAAQAHFGLRISDLTASLMLRQNQSFVWIAVGLGNLHCRVTISDGGMSYCGVKSGVGYWGRHLAFSTSPFFSWYAS
jgi:hypothetical protein